MSDLHRGRFSAEIEGDFVVLLIGMRLLGDRRLVLNLGCPGAPGVRRDIPSSTAPRRFACRCYETVNPADSQPSRSAARPYASTGPSAPVPLISSACIAPQASTSAVNV